MSSSIEMPTPTKYGFFPLVSDESLRTAPLIDSEYSYNSDGVYQRYSGIDIDDENSLYTYIPSFAEFCAKHISGSHNKNLVVMITGKQGTGKSNAALILAITTAKWLSYLKGGRPSDYFNIQKNLASIDPNQLYETVKSLGQHEVCILDDAGPGWDSRNSMSDRNKHLNYMLQTIRPMNNLIIVTTIDQMMVDKNVRRLTHYWVETAESMHAYGQTYLKICVVEENQRSDKTYYKFMRTHGCRLVRHLCPQIPPSLHEYYERVRREKQDMVRENYTEMKGNKEDSKQKSISNHELKFQERINDYGEKILELIAEQQSPYQISHRFDFADTYVSKIAKHFGYFWDVKSKSWRGT